LKLVGNFLSLASAEGLSKVATFAAFAFIARRTGAVGLGYVEFSYAIIMIGALVIDQGFDALGTREIAKAPSTVPQLVSQIVFIRFLLAILAVVVILVVAWFLPRPAIQTQLLVILSLSLVGMPLILKWVFQGLEKMPIAAGIQVFRQFGFAIIVFLGLRNIESIWVIGLAEVGGVVAGVAFGWWMYVRVLGYPFRLKLGASKKLLLDGLVIGLSQMLWSIKMFGATIVFGLMATSEEMGYFGGAMRILISLHMFVFLYYINILPSMSRTWQQSPEAFHELVNRSMRVVGWLAIGGGLLWVIVADVVIHICYGHSFFPAVAILRILAGVGVMAALSGHFRFGLIGAGFQKAEMWTQAVGAVVALTMLPVGYHFSGIQGAATSLVFAEATVWLTSWIAARRLLHVRGHTVSLLKPGLAVAVISTLLVVFGFTAPIITVLIAAVCVGCIAYVSEVSIRRWVKSIISR